MGLKFLSPGGARGFSSPSTMAHRVKKVTNDSQSSFKVGNFYRKMELNLNFGIFFLGRMTQTLVPQSP